MRVQHVVRVAALVVLAGACSAPGQRYGTIVDVAPVVRPELIGAGGAPDFEAMVDSYTGHGPVHAMTYYGDFDLFVREHHELILQHFAANEAPAAGRRGCSMFRVTAPDGATLVGRNFDNETTDLLVGWFFPVRGFASIALVPMSDLGFGGDRPFDPEVPVHRQTLLNAPVASIEGMNEKGLTVTLASLGRRHVDQHPDREPRFLLHLVRQLLDHAADVEEAIALASGYDVFDNGPGIISHHVLVTDTDDSVVLEWRDGSMHALREDLPRQVVTNSDLLDVAEADRRRRCGRYRRLATTFESLAEPLGWPGAMDALVSVAQRNHVYVIDGERLRVSTQWSVVFDPAAREALVCVHRRLGTVYRIRMP